MRSRAWGLAGGCALTLLVVVALVVWRAPGLEPGWRSVLVVVGLVAVVALSVATLIGGALGLRPEAPREISVELPRGGSPAVTSVTDAVGPRRWALAALAVAVVGTAPVLAVLVLASTADATLVSASPGGARAESPPATAPPDGVPPTSSPPTSSPPTSSPPTSASPTSSPPTSASPTSASPTGDPPGTPDGADPPGAPERSSGSDEARPEGGAPRCRVVVAAGDSLWTIALGRLAATGTEPSEDQVTAATARLYAANRGVVGPDPDLVRPGQRLDLCG